MLAVLRTALTHLGLLKIERFGLRNKKVLVKLLQKLAKILSDKTNNNIAEEEKQLKAELRKSTDRSEAVAKLYERLYEDNVSGKITDDWFMHLSRKYDDERTELKAKISDLRVQINSLENKQKGKDSFIKTVRRFMEMKTLTATLLNELIDRIEVYEAEGTGKNRTQRIVIYYRFVGYIEVPIIEEEFFSTDVRQGVAITYIPRMKESA